MSNLVYRSRRTQQRNRQSRKVNGNRSKRQIRNQRGGNNVEVSIYLNLKEAYDKEILTRPLTTIEFMEVQIYVEETLPILEDPKNSSSEDLATLIKSSKYSVEQLPSPYKNYHFVLKLTMPKTETNKLLDKELLKLFMEGLAGDYISFDYPYDYTGEKDKNQYFFSHDDYEIVGAGSTSLPPPPPPPPTVVNSYKNANTSFMSGKDGSLCNGLKTQNDCVGNPSVKKVCQWMPKTNHCQRKASLNSAVFSADSKKSLDAKEQARLASAREEYLQSRKSSGDVVSLGTKISESQASLAAPARQSVAVAPKKSIKSIPRVSTENRACVQKNYNIKTKAGSQYSVNRCILSDDPNVNDTDNCMWNPPTGRCRKVSRR
jgi:hypothetical protein